MEGKAKEEKAVQWLFILTVAFRVRCRLLLEMVRLCNGTPSRYSRSGHPWGAPCASLSTPAEHHCLVIELLSNIFNHHVAMGSEVLQNLTHPGLLICSSQLYSCNCIYWKARRVFFNSLENWKLFNLPFQNPFNPSLYQKEKAGGEISFWSLDHWAHCKMMLRLRHNHLTSKKKSIWQVWKMVVLGICCSPPMGQESGWLMEMENVLVVFQQIREYPS